MTLDRKDYKSAIPQLEKKIDKLTNDADNGLQKFDILLEQAVNKITATKVIAIDARTSANGKNTIYYANSAPTGTNFKIDDVWFDTAHDSQINRWNGTSWSPFTLGDDAIGNLNASHINAGTIDASQITVSNLDASNITSGTVDASHIDASTLTIGGSNLATQSNLTTAIDNISVGGRNLLRGTADMNGGMSGWASGQWRASGTGGTVTYNQTLTDPPIANIKGIKITPNSTNQIGFVQDYVPLGLQEITLSVWVKGHSGDKIDLQPIWANAQGEEEYGSKRFELTDTNWHKLEYTKTPNHAHASVSAGYVYLYANSSSESAVEFCAPQLEYGNKATDWSLAQEDVIEDGGKTATNYIEASGTGIKVHKVSDANNYVQITADGVDIVKGGSTIATYSDITEIRSTSGNSRIEIGAGELSLYSDEGTRFLHSYVDAGSTISYGTYSWFSDADKIAYSNTFGTSTLTYSKTINIHSYMPNISNGSTFTVQTYKELDYGSSLIVHGYYPASFVKGTPSTLTETYTGATFTYAYNANGTLTISWTINGTTNSNSLSFKCTSVTYTATIHPPKTEFVGDVTLNKDTIGNTTVNGDINAKNINVAFGYNYKYNGSKVTPSYFGIADYVSVQGDVGNWYYRKWNSGKFEAWYNSGSTTVTTATSSGDGWYRNTNAYSLSLPDINVLTLRYINITPLFDGLANGFATVSSYDINNNAKIYYYVSHLGQLSSQSAEIQAYIKGTYMT